MEALSCTVSIHAPVWVRRQSLAGGVAGRSFNSRTRVGATAVAPLYGVSSFVSIHAPVWVRPCKKIPEKLWNQFQFTHPCGCDSSTGDNPRTTKRFNSRTRVGATINELRISGCQWVSIHAPVWVRQVRLWLISGFLCFNSRTRVGATGRCTAKRWQLEVSIHAPVWVRLINGGQPPDNKTVSIHAPVWVRPSTGDNPPDNKTFQFTHPCGCDLGR